MPSIYNIQASSIPLTFTVKGRTDSQRGTSLLSMLAKAKAAASVSQWAAVVLECCAGDWLNHYW